MFREEAIKPIIDFIRELDKLKGVERKTRPLGLPRFENSAEHSWQLAVQAMALSRFVDGRVKLERVVGMLLLHDIGERRRDRKMASPRRRLQRRLPIRGREAE